MTSGALASLAGPSQARQTTVGISNARRAWRRFRQNRLALGSLAIAIVLIAIAVGAPLISTHITHIGPNKQSLIHRYQPGSHAHWLGTDEYGRDVVTRLVFALRISLGIAGLAALVTLVLGTAVGVAAAYYGGWVDQVAMRLVDILMTIPTMNLLILLGALFTVTPAELALALALISWSQLSRVIRGEVLSVRRREYIEAAKVIGVPNRTVIVRHVLPNISHLIVVNATMAIPSYILAEAGLSFLGLGIHPPTPSLGSMLNGATIYLYKRPELIIYPGALITLIALVVSIIGNALRDALDPRLSA